MDRIRTHHDILFPRCVYCRSRSMEAGSWTLENCWGLVPGRGSVTVCTGCLPRWNREHPDHPLGPPGERKKP